ncbi:MAG: hypothetical protein HZB25_09895 [Candidatus Eisenbacteria bacterium]|nr:hypothetical protein [Candidatus Eisenbacteria bacterium]
MSRRRHARKAQASIVPLVSRSAAWPFAAAAIGAMCWATWAAARKAWVCDDAFISFRYAENLVHGLGLVYNAGERVEGYSNFLWTMWVAAGLRLGADPEAWAISWGVACFAGSIALLAWNAWRLRREAPGAAPWLPVAAILFAVHPDAQVFGTSGLETPLYTLLAVLGYLLLAKRDGGPRLAAGAGAVLALASMTRPDGPLLAALAGAWVLAAGRPRLRCALAFSGAFLALWAPFTAWRVGYYGDFFPNPYYAKSASLGWMSQGWIYVRLYFVKYWAVAVGAALAGVAWAVSRARGEDPEDSGRAGWGPRAALAALFALGYTAYVMRVGGDFMFARLLIPATPFYLVMAELGVARLAPRFAPAQALLVAAAAAAVALTPYPFAGTGWISGIVHEWAFYSPENTATTKAHGLTLRRYFEGLPVRVAFLGSEARLVYYARPAVAIESQTGLTDRTIARLPLRARGRIGHEKTAPLDYLIEQRRCQFVFHPQAARELKLDEALPTLDILFDDVRGRVLRWDPPLMEQLRRRGARFDDFPVLLDGFLKQLPAVRDADVEMLYPGLKRIYFGHVRDPRREQPFLDRLAKIATARATARPGTAPAPPSR